MKRMPGIYCGNKSKRVTEVLGVREQPTDLFESELFLNTSISSFHVVC